MSEENALTLYEHFEAGEMLLAEAAGLPDRTRQSALAARAQAHFTAANALTMMALLADQAEHDMDPATSRAIRDARSLLGRRKPPLEGDDDASSPVIEPLSMERVAEPIEYGPPGVEIPLSNMAFERVRNGSGWVDVATERLSRAPEQLQVLRFYRETEPSEYVDRRLVRASVAEALVGYIRLYLEAPSSEVPSS